MVKTREDSAPYHMAGLGGHLPDSPFRDHAATVPRINKAVSAADWHPDDGAHTLEHIKGVSCKVEERREEKKRMVVVSIRE